MKMTSADLLDLKVIDKIFAEPEKYCVGKMDSVIRQLDRALEEFVEESSNLTKSEMAEKRYARFRNF
jgi:acetyl-CoA carboxylase alpha subunit